VRPAGPHQDRRAQPHVGGGIFAAGDVSDAIAEQVLIAVGEGAKAALSAYEYLLEQPPVMEPVAEGAWR
jgi:alkyl hydroperoxide reductase subunit AhpF